MTMIDDEHDQGFTNSKERNVIDTTHAYFEKIYMSTKRGLPLSFKKFKLGLI